MFQTRQILTKTLGPPNQFLSKQSDTQILKNEKFTVTKNVPVSQGIISEERVCQLTGRKGSKSEILKHLCN